jgi:hypothetical protein
VWTILILGPEIETLPEATTLLAYSYFDLVCSAITA